MSHQAGLFDDAELPPSPTDRAVVRIAAPAAALSKAQREFNRLSERIARLREELARWQAVEDRARRREAAELAPLHAKLTTRQREAALWIDAFLARPAKTGERLPKKLRTKLKYMLLLLARAVLAAGPDDEVEAAHDRHADQTHREDQREEADFAAAVFGEAMGDESLFEGPAESVDELMARAAARMRSQMEPQAGQDESEPAAGRRPSRAEKARARDAQALKEASQSVREIYRRLASSLHPDREPDAAERARKTTLMARVNEAYGRNDLLELLSVQMAIEQIDDEHLRGVSDERLRHYTRVLKEQEQTLQAELEAARVPLMQWLDEPPRRGGLAPEMFDRAIDTRLRDLRDALRYLDADFEQLRDARTRVAFLSVLEIEDPDEEIDPFEEMLLQEAISEMLQPSPPRGGGRRRRR